MGDLTVPPGFGEARNDVEWVAEVAGWAVEPPGSGPHGPVCDRCGVELVGMYWQCPEDDGTGQRAPWCESCAASVGQYPPVSADQLTNRPGGGA